jgi:hypothetical protein
MPKGRGFHTHPRLGAWRVNQRRLQGRLVSVLILTRVSLTYVDNDGDTTEHLTVAPRGSVLSA